jgi:hypothetical protein
MKTLLLSLLVVSTLVACGKKNEVSSNANASASNPITVSVQYATDIGSKIDNYTTQFGVGQLYYYGYPQTYQALVNSGLDLKYRYTKSATTSTGSGSNCELKWSIFYVCSYSNSSSSSTSAAAESRRVANNSVDVLSKQNELKAIINNVNPLIPIQTSGSMYMITTRDSKKYIIDTRYPLQSNPIGISDSSGTEYLYNITEI